MAFNNYLEDENDKPYFKMNSLAYYYDKMEGFAEKVEGSAKALNLTKEEVEKRLTLYIEQNKNEQDQRHALNKNELDQRLAQWDGNLETFDSSVETLLTEWVDDGTLINIIDTTLIDQKIAPLAGKLAETEKYNDVGYAQAAISNKIVYRASDNEFRVISRKPSRNGYSLMRFRKDIGAAADAANYGANWGLLRLDRVEDVSEAIVFEHPTTFTSSQLHTAGVDDFQSSSFVTRYTYPANRNFLSNTGRTKYGSFLEFKTTITKDHKGWVYIGFYGTSGANKNLGIYVDDVLIGTIDTSLAVSGIKTFGFDLGTRLGEVTIRLQAANDATSAGSVHLLGVNVMELNEVTRNLNFNGAMWNIAATPYITKSAGANDYAFLEASTGKWAGSYHGGETLEDSTLLLDGVDIAGMEIDSYQVGKSFKLIQSTDIIGKVKSQTVTEVTNDSTFSLNIGFKVPVSFLVTDFYAAMTCTNPEFNEVVYPQRAVLNSTSHTAYLPNAKKVIQMNPTTKQTITTIYSPLSDYKTNSPLFVQFSQYYSKVYHGLVKNSTREVKSMNFGTTKIFD